MIERKIIIGLITSTDFLRQIRDQLDIRLLGSNVGKRLASWCLEYFDTYKKAPGKDIEGIFYEKIKSAKNFPKEVAKEVEEEILPSLSEEYVEDGVNVDYLLDLTHKFLNERNLLLFSEKIKNAVDSGELVEAEKLASAYKGIMKDSGTWIDLSSPTVLNRIDKAFDQTDEILINYPGALGEFWNLELVREGFVALLACEKRGKTFMLLDMAVRASTDKKRVAFFQAGDLTEKQLLMRIAVYLTRKSNRSKYCGEMLEPVCDCVKNQLDSCTKKERECSFGLFNDKSEKELRREITIDELKKKFEEEPDYVNCTNCEDFHRNPWGTIWLKKVDVGNPLTKEEAKQKVEEFFIKKKRQFKVSTHPNKTLTVKQVRSILDIWERQENFIPDVIIIDYADLLEDSSVNEFRHKQNEIWKDLRGLSQEKHCLVITATQSDADSYSKNLLRADNFSEDKRKHAHITAEFGLNQDRNDREKKLGIMRINAIMVREGEFVNMHEVFVLQNLKRGRPFLTSYF